MRNVFHQLYRLIANVGSFAFCIAFVFLLLKMLAWLVIKVQPSENFFLGHDIFVVTRLDWLFLKAFDIFLYAACAYMLSNFFFGDRHPRKEYGRSRHK